MQYKYAEIGDVCYFWFAANTTAGAAGDGATPLYDVRLAGAAANAAPTASGTPTLLTHADYTDGLHEIAIDTAGYAAGEYAVFCTLTISTVNPAGFCGSFKLRAAGTAALGVNVVAQANIDFGALQKTSLNAATPLDARIPAALTGAGNMKSDSLAISGSTDAADKLEASAETIVTGIAQTGTLSTTQMTTNLTVSVADQYSGRIIIFKEDTTTAALRGQATDITVTEVLNGRLTFTAITTAPVNGDTFVIL